MPAAGADDLTNVRVELQDAVAIVHLARPGKRNALNDETVFSLERWFSRPPEQVKAVVLVGDGDHFCAGLDLSELKERSVAEGMLHSRSWHKAFEPIEFGTLPVVAVLHGAVVGGGLELAAAAHIRIAEASTFYALPEGSRGIYVGGGASVRVPKLVGVARMMDMMLTGRTYGADEGFCDRPFAVCRAERRRTSEGGRTREEDSRQRAAHQFRADAGAAAHRRKCAGSRLSA
jgi:enoyl-CoA hydratase/carnithine racemase